MWRGVVVRVRVRGGRRSSLEKTVKEEREGVGGRLVVEVEGVCVFESVILCVQGLVL